MKITKEERKEHKEFLREEKKKDKAKKKDKKQPKTVKSGVIQQELLLFLSASAVTIPFESLESRKSFLKENQIVGIYNDSTIAFDPKTGEFWSILKTHRYRISRSEVTRIGLTTAGCKKVIS